MTAVGSIRNRVGNISPRKLTTSHTDFFLNSFYAERMSTAIHAELPPERVAQARKFMKKSWATDLNELLAEALRRFQVIHRNQRKNYIRENVEWKLN